jgi:hypothetical protein
MDSYLIALATFALALIPFFMLRVLRTIHVLVNSRLSEALDDIAALKAALVDARRKKRP